MRARAEAVYEQVQAGLSDEERAGAPAALATIIANLSAAETRRTETRRPPPVGEGNRMNAQTDRKPREEAAAPRAPTRRRGSGAKPRRGRRRLLIAALPLALALGGGYVWATGGRYVATEDAYVKQDRVSVVPQVSGQIATVDGRRERGGRGGADALHHRRCGLPQRGRGGPGQARVRPARGREAEGRLCAGAVRGRDRARRAGDRGDPRRPPAEPAEDAASCRRPPPTTARWSCSRPAARSPRPRASVLSAKAALAGDPDIATDRHPAVLRGARRRCTRPSSTSRTPASRAPRGGRGQPDRPAAAGPVRDPGRAGADASSPPTTPGSRRTTRRPTSPT